ncbi:hypothetical protein [Dickeya phage Amaethon]|nr:hypothetical protein [Dickeya phage Amaethon]
MDKDVERELERFNKRLDSIEATQQEQGHKIYNLARDILRFWHIGLGMALGLVVKELGVEKLLGHLL